MRHGHREVGAARGMSHFWLGRLAAGTRGLALTLLLSLATLLPAPMPAQESAKPATTLAPEIETKLAEFLRRAREAKRGIWRAQSRNRIDQLAEAAGIEPERVKALQKPAEDAIARSLDAWEAVSLEGWRKWAAQFPADTPELFDQILAQVDQYVRSDYFADYVRPLEQPGWIEAMRATLTPEQVATWERMEQERQEAVRKEIAEAFDAAASRIREGLRATLMKKGEAIKKRLRQPEKRAAELDALANRITDSAPEVWRVRATRNFLWMDDDHRRAMVQTHFHINPDDKETATLEAAWEDGVTKLLSPEETKRLRSTQNEFKERRIAALSRILITQLDEQVAFTASQRERLQGIGKRLVSAEPSLLPDWNDEGHYQINVQTLLGCGRKATEEEMRTILDATQWRRWQAACSGTSSGVRSAMIAIRANTSAPVAKAPAQPGEPEDVENAISDHLYEKAAAERKRLLAAHLLKAEDAARVAGLPEETARLLETAARGSAEEELALWKTGADQTVRSQLREVTPENVKQRLASMNRFAFGRRTGSQSDPGALWEGTVNAALTDAQRATWQKELDARNAYRDDAIATLILAEFDRRQSLTTTQWSRLEPLVAASLKTYGPDIASMFSTSFSQTWYLQSHSMFIPLAAVPEADLKAILTKEQRERWTGGEHFGNTKNYLENVRRLHENRVKENKERGLR